jgi:hypothetical protein
MIRGKRGKRWLIVEEAVDIVLDDRKLEVRDRAKQIRPAGLAASSCPAGSGSPAGRRRRKDGLHGALFERRPGGKTPPPTTSASDVAANVDMARSSIGGIADVVIILKPLTTRSRTVRSNSLGRTFRPVSALCTSTLRRPLIPDLTFQYGLVRNNSELQEHSRRRRGRCLTALPLLATERCRRYSLAQVAGSSGGSHSTHFDGLNNF